MTVEIAEQIERLRAEVERTKRIKPKTVASLIIDMMQLKEFREVHLDFPISKRLRTDIKVPTPTGRTFRIRYIEIKYTPKNRDKLEILLSSGGSHSILYFVNIARKYIGCTSPSSSLLRNIDYSNIKYHILIVVLPRIIALWSRMIDEATAYLGAINEVSDRGLKKLSSEVVTSIINATENNK